MKFMLIITLAFIFLIPLSPNVQAVGWFSPENYQRILEEGYSDGDIFALLFLVILGTSVSAILFLRERRKKINK